MPEVKIRTYVQERRVGPLFSRGSGRNQALTSEMQQLVATDIFTEFMRRASADISGAGKFGRRWTDGFTAQISQGGGNVRLDISHRVPYFNVFTKTTTIKGKPWLYFPPSPDVAIKGLRPGQPLPPVIRKRQVTIPQKFHTFDIARDVASRAGELFRARMRDL